MEAHAHLTDKQFEIEFLNATLAPTLFTHDAHLRLAWIHIHYYGINNAIENVTLQIKAYVKKLGVTDKYNETLTVAAIRTVYHFYLKTKTETFQEFIAQYPRLKTHFKDLLEQHYGFDIFRNEEAKTSYLAPDLQPFD